MSKTSIEWTERTWNPIRARNRETSKRGWFCTKVASECKNCYAERMNSGRFGNGIRYAVDQADKVELYLDQRVLEEPLHIRKPSTFFVCSMTDLYGEFVPDEWISEVYAVMALAGALHKGHTFQILTKRPERRLHFLTQTEEGKGIAAAKYAHIWEGVSAGTKKCADAYLDILRQTPAITRWWSAEPLLEDVLVRNLNTLLINWVVVGGESGPGARPMYPSWARSLRNQCKAAGVPFFFKQFGEWAPTGPMAKRQYVCECGKHFPPSLSPVLEAHKRECKGAMSVMYRVGKKAAGRLLDGVEHSEYPEGHHD